MPVHQQFQVEPVQQYPNGHGFSISNQYHRPLFLIVYPTDAAAEAAHSAIATALANAMTSPISDACIYKKREAAAWPYATLFQVGIVQSHKAYPACRWSCLSTLWGCYTGYMGCSVFSTVLTNPEGATLLPASSGGGVHASRGI
jgi:hypothetical protein